MESSHVFDDEDYLKAFESVRFVPLPMRDWYAWDLLRRVHPSSNLRVLDAGAGLGQFAEPVCNVAQSMDLPIELTLLDSSAPVCQMLGRMPWKSPTPNIVHRRIEDASSDLGRFQAILLSEVLHLFDDLSAPLTALRDMTSADSVVAVRFGTREQVKSRDWYRWYPESQEIDIDRNPSGERLLKDFEAAGFSAKLYPADESRWIRASTFQDMMIHRAFSAFRMIDPEMHAKRSEAMLADTATLTDVWFSYEMSWLIAHPK